MDRELCAAFVELPQLVAVAAPPLALDIVGLVLEPDRDPVVPEGPQVLAQGIVEFTVPLGGEELDDRGPPGEEAIAVAPGRVDGVRARDALRVADVPGVLGGLHL